MRLYKEGEFPEDPKQALLFYIREPKREFPK
jgi:hypothetical protein